MNESYQIRESSSQCEDAWQTVAIVLELKRSCQAAGLSREDPLMYLLSKLYIYSDAALSSGFWQEGL